jgi:hypothetical protein
MAASDYWGYLVKPDKSPSPVFEQLLLGIANYIVLYLATSTSLILVMDDRDSESNYICDVESTRRAVGYHLPDAR